jgi:uncharacterized membrane protein
MLDLLMMALVVAVFAGLELTSRVAIGSAGGRAVARGATTTAASWVQIALFTALIGAMTWPLGGYMARVFSGERTVLGRALQPVERAVYCLAGMDPGAEQEWHVYGLSLLAFDAVGVVAGPRVPSSW